MKIVVLVLQKRVPVGKYAKFMRTEKKRNHRKIFRKKTGYIFHCDCLWRIITLSFKRFT